MNDLDLLDLNNLRNKINEIDDNIVEFLLERFAVVKDVAEYKKANGLEILQKNREEEVLQNISDKIGDRECKEYILYIYQSILETSKKSQI